ncbi:MAG: hypothetical protein AAGI01_15830 [Myxococcota bacterium]
MPPRNRKPTLAKLQEKQAELAAQIKEIKRQERRDQLELERKRYLILGRALAKELAENDALAAQLDPVLNARITKPRERDLMGLPPLTEPPAAGQ